jgi:hypothetical protein
MIDKDRHATPEQRHQTHHHEQNHPLCCEHVHVTIFTSYLAKKEERKKDAKYKIQIFRRTTSSKEYEQ